MPTRVRGAGRVEGDSRHAGHHPLGRGKWVGLAGQRGQRGGNLGQAGADVGRRGAGLAAAVGVAGVGPGDGVPEITLTGRVASVWRSECMP
jgi:hypothetical protein